METNEPKVVLEFYNKLCKSELYEFPEKGKVNLTNKHGVYIIYSSNNEILHVGMTPYGKDGLNQRLYNHISKSGVFYREYLKPRNMSLRGTCKFRYIEIEDARIRALLEALTAGKLCPAHFGTGLKRM
jgi:predicted GIY-YIG superfamily endonuclease